MRHQLDEDDYKRLILEPPVLQKASARLSQHSPNEKIYALQKNNQKFR